MFCHQNSEEKLLRIVRLMVAAIVLVASGHALADEPGDPTAVKSENGKYLDEEGNPTCHVAADGAVRRAISLS